MNQGDEKVIKDDVMIANVIIKQEVVEIQKDSLILFNDSQCCPKLKVFKKQKKGALQPSNQDQGNVNFVQLSPSP